MPISGGTIVPKLWMYWEDPPGKVKPPYLNLCLKTIRRYCGEQFDINIIDRYNVRQYFSDIHPKWELLALPAHRADYIRCKAVLEYGGIWLDSDTILLQSLTPWYSLLSHYDFLCYEWNGRDPSIGAFVARKHSPLLSEWYSAIREELSSRDTFDWCALGNDLLHPILRRKFASGYTYHSMSARNTVAPIAWDEASSFFLDTPMHSFKRTVQPFLVLYNQMFPLAFKQLSEEDILASHTLIARFFRLALSISEPCRIESPALDV